MLRFTLFLLLTTYLVSTVSFGQVQAEADGLIVLGGQEEQPIVERFNWDALGNDLDKISPALAVLQQELIPGSPLDLNKAYEQAQNELCRNIERVAQLKADKIKSIFRPVLDGNSLSEDQKSLVREYRKDLTELIIESARNRSSENLDSITVYKDLGNSIDLYLLLDDQEYKNQDYSTFLNELQGSLYDYASAHRDTEYREALGKNVARLKAIGEANYSASAGRFVHAIDRLTRQPNVLMSVSEDAINEMVRSSKFGKIAKTDLPVSECILGTAIRGTADTTIMPQIELRNGLGCAALDIYLSGEVKTDSIGYQKPVQIKTVGLSPFIAQTQITFNDKGLAWTPPIASANTNTTICSIEKVGSPCFSRIIERIAWRKAAKNKPLAEAIGSEKMARRLEKEIGNELSEGLSKTGGLFDKIRPLSKVLGGLDINSTETELKIGLAYSRLGELTVPLHLPAPHRQSTIPKDMTTPGDMTIQIHQSLVNQIKRRKFNSDNPEEKIALSIAILDRLVDELFSDGQDSSDSKFFELVIDSLRNPSSSSGDQGDGSGTIKKLRDLQLNLKLPDYEEETEWFTIHVYIEK